MSYLIDACCAWCGYAIRGERSPLEQALLYIHRGMAELLVAGSPALAPALAQLGTEVQARLLDYAANFVLQVGGRVLY